MDIDLVLVPVDGSERAERAADCAVAVAERYGADLHLLFVVDERLQRDIDAGRVDPEAVAEDHRTYTERVRSSFGGTGGSLDSSTAAAFSEHRLMQTPGSVVLDAAEDVDADFIVVPREGEGGEAAVGRAALYVLEYASQPVLSV
ncbi:universal stress protein [Haloarcula litorea]|uniref:universal stress protein n=1 Tax=Haloarcula litorea TaxID=3032579 RepID=UPI0023E8C68D|nr:universal stress protein [Halomicroarcula sp. GDY20]